MTDLRFESSGLLLTNAFLSSLVMQQHDSTLMHSLKTCF